MWCVRLYENNGGVVWGICCDKQYLMFVFFMLLVRCRMLLFWGVCCVVIYYQILSVFLYYVNVFDVFGWW